MHPLTRIANVVRVSSQTVNSIFQANSRIIKRLRVATFETPDYFGFSRQVPRCCGLSLFSDRSTIGI